MEFVRKVPEIQGIPKISMNDSCDSKIWRFHTLRQLLEKTLEFKVDTHHLFIKRSELFITMSTFSILSKISRLCWLTLANIVSVVRIGNHHAGIPLRRCFIVRLLQSMLGEDNPGI